MMVNDRVVLIFFLRETHFWLWIYKKEKPKHLLRLLSLGYPDSNQERQDQNLQCYHYTIAQSFSGAKVLLFFITASIFANFYRFFCIFS